VIASMVSRLLRLLDAPSAVPWATLHARRPPHAARLLAALPHPACARVIHRNTTAVESAASRPHIAASSTSEAAAASELSSAGEAPRFFHPHPLPAEAGMHTCLEDTEAVHAAKSLRLTTGDALELCDAQGWLQSAMVVGQRRKSQVTHRGARVIWKDTVRIVARSPVKQHLALH